eukprot:CAMPEP_0117605936 /NCGR_PEP_ID=MMETSP0784-20121206/79451_1 /TAXON_ID=39447 /ORGANISM="" /LENGTH=345 /DNA_ID=CAMNT_0005408997 /DNA_START=28 /DNA_END=1066 /DNA_ORIENTATION=+
MPPSALRLGVLRIFAAQLGYALRKAFPHLRDGDRELFVADVLGDLGVLLRPQGDLRHDVQLMAHHAPVLDLLTAVAARPILLGWAAPDISDHVACLSDSLAVIDELNDAAHAHASASQATTAEPGIMTDTDDIDFSKNHFEPGPISLAIQDLAVEWPLRVYDITTSFARLAAALPAALLPSGLPPLRASAPPPVPLLHDADDFDILARLALHAFENVETLRYAALTADADTVDAQDELGDQLALAFGASCVIDVPNFTNVADPSIDSLELADFASRLSMLRHFFQFIDLGIHLSFGMARDALADWCFAERLSPRAFVRWFDDAFASHACIAVHHIVEAFWTFDFG